MREESENEDINPLFLKYKIYFIFGFIALVVLGFLIGFFVLRVSPKILDREQIIPSALDENNIRICDRLEVQSRVSSCKILVNVNLGNENYCYDADNSIFGEFVLYGEEIMMGHADYCWMLMTQRNKINYCDNIEKEEAKQLCLLNYE